MRDLDPSGQLVEAAGVPVRAYLRDKRPDTIRCLVAFLTGDSIESEGLGSLQEELTRPTNEDSEGEDADTDALALRAHERWIIQSGTSQRPSQDIVNSLVGIFGNQDFFIQEYRSLLGERLLGRHGFETDRDIRTLELLKMRFGDLAMLSCEVMLKDLIDSRRLMTSIGSLVDITWPAKGLSTVSLDPRFKALVVSQAYWPVPRPDDSENITMPPAISTAMATYSQAYTELKAPRKLKWMHHVGVVTLDVFVGEESRTVEVTPLQAAVLWAFTERSHLSRKELAATCGVSANVLPRRLTKLVSLGLLSEIEMVDGEAGYARATSLSSSALHGGAEEDRPGEAGACRTTAAEALAEKMSIHQQYITGMLNNFEDGLTLARIHNMLNMFVMDGTYTASEEELGQFLEQLATNDVLVTVGGVYRLASSCE